MGFRFRKSIKIGPARINLSKSGVGYSIGTKGLRYTKPAKGKARTTVSIPGTGISYTTSTGSKRKSKKAASQASSYSSATNSWNPLLVTIGFLVALVVIYLLKEYWLGLLLLGVIGVCIYLLIRFAKARNEANMQEAPMENPEEYQEEDPEEYQEEDPEEYPEECQIATDMIDKSAEALPDPAMYEEPAAFDADAAGEELAASEQPPAEDIFQQRKAAAIAQFDSELSQIFVQAPPVAEAVPRQLLKDLPGYQFSNITRKTRLDSIFPLVVLDIETTGLKPSSDEIIEISAIKFVTGMVPVEAISTLCKPKKAIPAEASAVNHITDEMVQNAPRFAEIAPAVTEFMKDCNLAGHNLDFDLRFIHASGAKLPEGTRYYDTLDLAHLTVPSSSVRNYRLDTLCSYYGIWWDSAHRSLSDCYATAKLLAGLVKDKTDRQLIADQDLIDSM